MKKLSVLLLFILLVPAFAQANGTEPTAAKNALAVDDPILYIDLENNFWFQEKVHIHISDAADKTLVSNAYSREELQKDKALKDLLRKSTLYLTIGDHYYFFMEE
ncbi:hypothetical protein [Cesiribacter sp. SM1]|uniref:hypothetical protein n=1 Tax=Cesiribacter sp. SM1 TaxID=2861196 RepID=UPI001CD2658F|nr:hypothetical protein [Cesiribacter sp. SM1]